MKHEKKYNSQRKKNVKFNNKAQQPKKKVFYKWTSIRENGKFEKIDLNAIGECLLDPLERRDMYHPPFPFTIGRTL